MIFVTGSRYSGKKTYIQKSLGLSEQEFAARAVRNVQELAVNPDPAVLETLAEELSRKEIVMASETGCGVIPLDPEERIKREAAGRLACLLAEKADVVIRMCCGLPEILKGEWPYAE